MWHQIESLESRQLLSVINVSFNQNNGGLEIRGSNGPDNFKVDISRAEYADGATVTIWNNNRKSKVFGKVVSLNVYGQGGDDKITVTGGNESTEWHWAAIYAGDGNDIIAVKYNGALNVSGEAGNDIIDARRAIDPDAILSTNAHNLFISGGKGRDYIVGSVGNDNLYGDDGNDTLLGGAGDDTLKGGPGRNHLNGGEGNDRFIMDPLNSRSRYPDTWNTGGHDYILGGKGTGDKIERYVSSSAPQKPIFSVIAIGVEQDNTTDVDTDGKG